MENNIKICMSCKIPKNEDDFSSSEFQLKHPRCKKCIKIKNAKFRAVPANKEKEKSNNKKYRESHAEQIAQDKHKIYLENKNKFSLYNKQYNLAHKEDIKANKRKYEKEKLKNDVIYKCSKYVSIKIRKGLKNLNVSKNKQSIWKFLPYTPEELKFHIENQFEPWMTWENWGIYDPKIWNENDSSTWTWQLDHIKPHSDFNYGTMDCREFLDCWMLSNLRPLSAKQNYEDGIYRIRHKKKER